MTNNATAWMAAMNRRLNAHASLAAWENFAATIINASQQKNNAVNNNSDNNCILIFNNDINIFIVDGNRDCQNGVDEANCSEELLQTFA